MSPRRYKADRRKAAMAQTRRRIVAATVKLHAAHGGIATTYAMIAKRADVAVPTVYNHFPTIGDLLNACAGHVSSLAPPLGPQIFAAAADTEARVAALTRAVFAGWRFRAPWMRWGVHEAALVPELRAILEKARDGLRQLIALALAPRFGQRPPEALAGLFEILLDFTAWQRLTGDGALTGAEAETTTIDALDALTRLYDAPGRRGRSRAATDGKTRRTPA